MAHHKSAKKRIRQTERRTEVNRARVSRIRTFVKKVETLIEGGDKNQIHAAQNAAALAIRDCMAALDQFKLAGSRSGALFRHSVPL